MSDLPRRRRVPSRVADSEEEDDAPVRRRRRPVAEKETPAEEEKPTRRMRGGTRSRSHDSGFQSGWKAAKRLREQNSPFASEARIGETSEIYFFLDSAPFVSYLVHWLQRKGKRSFVCPRPLGQDCPLCDELDDRPSANIAFNVIHVPKDGEGLPALKVLNAASRLTTTIEAESNALDEVGDGLDGNYFRISRTGERQTLAYRFQLIKERDLEEDFGVTPLTEADIDKLAEKMYTKDTFPERQKLSDLEEIAAEQAAE